VEDAAQAGLPVRVLAAILGVLHAVSAVK